MPDNSVTEHPHDISEADESRSLDVSDYVQLLENADFVDPEQRREELESEVPDIEDDDLLEQEPLAMPDELFTANNRLTVMQKCSQLQLIIYFPAVKVNREMEIVMRTNRSIAMARSQLRKVFC